MIKYPLSLILPNYTSANSGEYGEFFIDITRKNELSNLRFSYLSSSPSYYPILSNALRQSNVPVVLSTNTALYSTIKHFKPRPIEYNVLSINAPILPLNNNNELVYLEYDVDDIDKSALPDYDETSFYKRPLSSTTISEWLKSETHIDDEVVDSLIDALLSGNTWLNWFNKGIYEGNRIKTYNVWPMLAPEAIEEISDSETTQTSSFTPIVTTPYVWHEKTSFDVVVSCNIDAFSSLPIAVPKGKVKDYSVTNAPGPNTGLSSDLTIEWSAYDKDGWTWERTSANANGSSSAGVSHSAYQVASTCYYNNLDCKSNLAMLNLRFGNANRPLINNKALESILSTQYKNLTPPFGGWNIYNNDGLRFNTLLNQTFSYKVPYRLDGVANDDGYIHNPNNGKPHYQINSQIPAEYNEGTISLSDVIVGGTFLYPIKDDYSENFNRYLPVTNYELLTNGNGERLMMTGDYNGIYNVGFSFDIKLNQSALSDDYSTILDTSVLTNRDIPLNYTGSTFRLRDLIARPEPKRWYIVLWINPTGHRTIGYQPTTNTYDYIESLIATHPGYGHELTILYADSGRNFPFVPVLFKSKTLSRRLPTLNITPPLEFEFDSVLSNVCDNVVDNINMCIPFNESRISTPDDVFYDVASDIAKKIKFSVYAKQINTSAGYGNTESHEPNSSNAKARFTGTLLEK